MWFYIHLRCDDEIKQINNYLPSIYVGVRMRDLNLCT